jgi:vacuolar protein-sorting-associated protein 4
MDNLRDVMNDNFIKYTVEQKNGNLQGAFEFLHLTIKAILELHPLASGMEKQQLKSDLHDYLDIFEDLSDKLKARKKPEEKLSFNDIVGNEEAKKYLKRKMMTFRGASILGMTPSCPTILLYGPNGSGKSFIAEAMANEWSSDYFSVSASQIKDKYVGESEKALERIFEQARKCSTSVIFFDEIHLLFAGKDSDESPGCGTKSVFLREMSSAKNNGIVLLGATNYPWKIEPAILRRFKKTIEISLPNAKDRALIMQKKIEKSGMLSIVKPKEWEAIGKSLKGYTASDLASIVESAQDFAMETVLQTSFVTGATYKGKQIHVACKEWHKGAVKIDIQKDGKRLCTKAVMVKCYLDLAVKSTRMSVTSTEDANKMNQFRKSY